MKSYIEVNLERDYAVDLMNCFLYHELMMRSRGIEVSPMYYGFVSRLFEKIYGYKSECLGGVKDNNDVKKEKSSRKR